MTNFLAQGKSWHFTYKTHIDFEQLKTFILKQASTAKKPNAFKWFTVVHESSDNENQYDHTHFACEFTIPLKTTMPRLFDWANMDSESIHPHWQKITSLQHATTIYFTYHKKAPVSLAQSENAPGGFEFDLSAVKQASTLVEAMSIAGIKIRTLADLKLLRSDIPRRPIFEHKRFHNTEWTLKTIDDWKVLVLYGSTNTGKTQWATHQFINPLVCSHMDDLKFFNRDEHDGIVFDDMSFSHYPRETIIHLLDWDLDRSIHNRYANAFIPKHTRKIFTSNLNLSEIFPVDTSGAIARRISKVYKISAKLYKDKPPISPPIEIPTSLLSIGKIAPPNVLFDDFTTGNGDALDMFNDMDIDMNFLDDFLDEDAYFPNMDEGLSLQSNRDKIL